MVDGVIEAYHRLQTLQIDHAVDSDASLPRVGLYLVVLATLDPAIPEHRVVLRMDRIHEADDVVLVLVLLELFVLGKQRLLGLRVGPA